jgi:3-deoxy-D-manno-octulosonic-acid transferase
MHCASLGEFEQGRPVLEAIRKQHPACFIHVSFFSPSGFEAVEGHPLLDSVSYLPPDTPENAEAFVRTLHPSLVLWVRYDFWYWMLKAAARSEAHCVCIAALFRPSQPFFQPWGGFFRTMLKAFHHIFVQNQSSEQLLRKIGFSHVSVIGDTRFDRVWEQSKAAVALDDFEKWVATRPLLVAGSVWPEDMEVLCNVFAQLPEYCIVVAPHEVRDEDLLRSLQPIKEPFGLYSKGAWEHRIVILNTIGLLSRLYRYATVAYVGGAFGQGLHNCLEPATFGVGMVFGPNIDRYPEAQELVQEGAAIRISTSAECVLAIRSVVGTPQMGKIAANYVSRRVGATEKIIHYLHHSWKA